ncbi:MAG TPA: hypothetical protein VLE43_03435 [Candidatus Saccharimonadia bacterium]|nr:hypothetical protein [Candidatus Saccharimonadia bacterium]
MLETAAAFFPALVGSGLSTPSSSGLSDSGLVFFEEVEAAPSSVLAFAVLAVDSFFSPPSVLEGLDSFSAVLAVASFLDSSAFSLSFEAVPLVVLAVLLPEEEVDLGFDFEAVDEEVAVPDEVVFFFEEELAPLALVSDVFFF